MNPTCAVCGGRLRGAKKCSCDQPHDHWKPVGKRRGKQKDEDDRLKRRRAKVPALVCLRECLNTPTLTLGGTGTAQCPCSLAVRESKRSWISRWRQSRALVL